MAEPKVLRSQKKQLEGIEIQRVLPQAQQRMVGPFIFLDHINEATSVAPMKVTSHPHVGLATLTYLFSGQVEHRDSLGNRMLIKAGEVNWMEAGKGISHSEQTIPSSEPLHGLQFWVALPDHLEDIEPSFRNYPKKSVPQIILSDLVIDVIVGKYAYLESPVKTHCETLLVHFLSEGPQKFFYNSRDLEVGFYLIQGQMALNGVSYNQGDFVIFKAGETIHIELFNDTRMILLGGEPFLIQKKIFWNFVASTKEKLKKAQEDWNEGNFPMVPGVPDRILSPVMKI